MRARIALLLAGISGAAANGSGINSCENVPGHGTTPSGSVNYAVHLLDTNGLVLNPTLGWSPGVTYEFRIAPASGPTATSPTFAGFEAGLFAGGFVSFSNAKQPMTIVTTATARVQSFCTNGYTHFSSVQKSQVSFRWTAPAAITTDAFTFRAIVVASYSTPYFVLTLTLPPGAVPSGTGTPAVTPPPSASVAMSSIPALPSFTSTGTAAPTATSTATATSSATRPASATPTGSSGATASLTASGTPSSPATATSSSTAAATATQSATASGTGSSTATGSVSGTVSASVLPTQTATKTRMPSRTRLPSRTRPASLSATRTKARSKSRSRTKVRPTRSRTKKAKL